MIKLSTEQRESIQAGARARKRLIREASKAAQRALNTDRDVYLDTLIAGDSGVGKTFNIKRELKNKGVRFIEMTGNVSLFGLMGNLMLLHNAKPKNERLVIFLDDCDFLFEAKNLNMLKHMTATQVDERKFEYKKAIQKGMFSEAQQDLLPLYMNEEEGGLTIPCDEFIFIIASNVILPDESSLLDMTTTQRNRADHLLAIRGRMNVFDFNLTKQEKWGWLYEVAINDNALDMLDNDNDRIYLLDWMWTHWDLMKETSVRTTQKMAYEIIDEPEDYKDNWELDFLKY